MKEGDAEVSDPKQQDHLRRNLREVDFGFGFDDEEGVGVGVAGVAEFLAGALQGFPKSCAIANGGENAGAAVHQLLSLPQRSRRVG
jgi:hypothetical protein